jgi:hypothetical protein
VLGEGPLVGAVIRTVPLVPGGRVQVTENSTSTVSRTSLPTAIVTGFDPGSTTEQLVEPSREMTWSPPETAFM